MRPSRRLACVLSVTLCVAAMPPVWAAPTPISVGGAAANLEAVRLLEQGKRFFRDGEYAQAKPVFAQALAVEPGFTWAQLYLQLCDRRLSPEAPFPVTSKREQAQRAGVSKALEQQERQARRSFKQEVAQRERRLDRAREELRKAAERSAKEQTQRRLQHQRETAADRAAALLKAREQSGVAGQLGRLAPTTTVPPSGPTIPAPSMLPAPLTQPTTQPMIQPMQPTMQPPPPAIPAPLALPPEAPAPSAGAPPVELPSMPIIATVPGEAHPPVTIHGDEVEFSPDQQKVIGSGHIIVKHEEVTLTADRVVVFMNTKDAFAEGHVRLFQSEGMTYGELMYYNFNTKKGTVFQTWAQFTSGQAPIYVAAAQSDLVSAHEIRAKQAWVTTCDLPNPHYAVHASEANVYLDDKVVMRNVNFKVGRLWLGWLPRWTYSLKEDRPKVSIVPGMRKQWGLYLLSAWRYELNANAKGNVLLDWRNKFGWGQGIDLRYHTAQFGEGLLRSYYNQSTDALNDEPTIKFGRFDRYRLLWRHRWQLDPDTLAIVDYQKFSDPNFRKDFLFREEFAEDTNPDSFFSLVRTRPEYALSLVAKKRVNRFQDATEQLPESKLDIFSQQLGDTPLYYRGTLTGGNYQTKTARPSDVDSDVFRLDSFHELSWPVRWFRALNFRPRFSTRQTYYSKDKQGSDREGERDLLRSVFQPGIDGSTKLYRIFETHTNILGLDINRLRHIITPSFDYTYNPRPTTPPGNLASFDGIDGIDRQNSITVSLENKLQTKRAPAAQWVPPRYQRKGTHDMESATEIGPRLFQTLGPPATEAASPGAPAAPGAPATSPLVNVDLARFVVSSAYDFQREDGARWGNVTFDLELQPYAWMRVESDAAYDHRQDQFLTWNVDWIFHPPTAPYYAAIGHRYATNDQTEETVEFGTRLGQKWWVDMLTRFDVKEVVGSVKRFNRMPVYQTTLVRDLHDWFAELTYRVDRDFGEELFFVLRLKAFPEMPVDLKESYHQPKLGSQSDPFFTY